MTQIVNYPHILNVRCRIGQNGYCYCYYHGYWLTPIYCSYLYAYFHWFIVMLRPLLIFP